MFTGIIQNLANVISYKNNELQISTSLDLSDCEIGSSICCNGVCLTLIEINSKEDHFTFKVNIGEETQQRTNFSNNAFNKLADINIEKSLKIGDEISGHFVYGHIDCTTIVKNINKIDNSWTVDFHKPEEISHYFIEKGFITIDIV